MNNTPPGLRLVCGTPDYSDLTFEVCDFSFFNCWMLRVVNGLPEVFAVQVSAVIPLVFDCLCASDSVVAVFQNKTHLESIKSQ